jgi:hypothetical protein
MDEVDLAPLGGLAPTLTRYAQPVTSPETRWYVARGQLVRRGWQRS